MRITVAICTWNRAELLDQTLHQFRQLKVMEGVQWELLVVNNNSNDETEAVLARHVDSLPLQRLMEPKQGHCHARNCAIKAAAGEWILWTDDDVLVDPQWLTEYVNAIQENPQCSYAGGTIEPWFEKTPPRWLARHLDSLEGAFAIIRRDIATRELGKSESIFGANMAFRTDVLKANLFDPAVGLVGDNPMRGDETELVSRLVAAGHQGLWAGRARVRHYIPQSRMTTAYLWNFFFGYGRAQTRLSPRQTVSTFLRRPRWALRAYLSSRLASQILLPFKNAIWLRHFQRAATCAGIIEESLSARSQT